MIYIPNVWPKPCPKRLLLPTWREYIVQNYLVKHLQIYPAPTKSPRGSVVWLDVSWMQEVDIWSFGCFLLEMLTLRMPYQGLPDSEIYDLILVRPCHTSANNCFCSCSSGYIWMYNHLPNPVSSEEETEAKANSGIRSILDNGWASYEAKLRDHIWCSCR